MHLSRYDLKYRNISPGSIGNQYAILFILATCFAVLWVAVSYSFRKSHIILDYLPQLGYTTIHPILYFSGKEWEMFPDDYFDKQDNSDGSFNVTARLRIEPTSEIDQTTISCVSFITDEDHRSESPKSNLITVKRKSDKIQEYPLSRHCFAFMRVTYRNFFTEVATEANDRIFF